MAPKMKYILTKKQLLSKARLYDVDQRIIEDMTVQLFKRLVVILDLQVFVEKQRGHIHKQILGKDRLWKRIEKHLQLPVAFIMSHWHVR